MIQYLFRQIKHGQKQCIKVKIRLILQTEWEDLVTNIYLQKPKITMKQVNHKYYCFFLAKKNLTLYMHNLQINEKLHTYRLIKFI